MREQARTQGKQEAERRGNKGARWGSMKGIVWVGEVGVSLL